MVKLEISDRLRKALPALTADGKVTGRNHA